MRLKSFGAKRFLKALALGSAIAVAAVGLPFAAAAPASAVDPILVTASPTANSFAISKVGSSYKIALDLNDAKYSNKTVNVYVTRIVYGQKIIVASRSVRLGTGAVGSTTTTRKIKAGDTIKVTKGALVVFTRKVTSVGLGDVIHPTLNITDNVNGLATGPVTYTFAFSEPVIGFTADDVAVVGGTKGTLTGSGASYSMVVTPNTDSTAAITVDVAANSATDAAKNGNVAAAQNVQLANTHNPAVLITDDTAGTVHSNEQVIFTFTFNQPVTGFDASDVTVAHGTKGAFVATSQTVYTLVVTSPADSFSGNMTVDVAAGVATSSTTSATNLAAVQDVQPVNTTAPTVTITDDNGGTVYAGQNVTFTFTFSEAVTGFTTGDVVVTGGTKGAFTATTALVYTLVVTPTDASTTQITVDVAAGVATSVATNNGNAVAVQRVQPVDTTHPTATITNNASIFTDGITDQATAILYTFAFDKPVVGFDAADVAVTNGVAGAFTIVDSSHYTMSVVPNANLIGNLTVAVIAGGATASVTGNADAASSLVQKVNLVNPLVKITGTSPTAIASGLPVTLTATFNKSVVGLTTSGLTVTGGTATSVTTGTGINWSISITPAAASQSVTVSVNAGAVTGCIASLPVTQTIGGPTVVLSGAPGTGAIGTPYTVTITFSSAVTDFIRSDITVTGLANGSEAVLTGSGTSYTLTITPTTAATVTVSVAAGVATATNTVTNTASNTASTVVS
jgi:hypothetical protein